jgi:DNA primase
MDKEDFIVESHRMLFEQILSMRESEQSARKKAIELKLKDPDIIGEWINILEYETVYDRNNIDNFVDDCIKEIKKYKLEESKKEIMLKIKGFEAEGKLQESMELAKEFIKIQKKGV